MRFLPAGGSLATGIREVAALTQGGVAGYINLDPKVSLDVDYTADALPTAASPAWTGGASGAGQSESVSGGELSTNDAGSGTTTYARTEASLATGLPALIGARCKVASENNTGIPVFLGLSDGTKQLGIRWRPSVNRVIFCDFGSQDRGGGLTDALDLDITAYHVYEVCKITSSRVDLYIDGVRQASIAYSAFGAAGGKTFDFGHPSGSGQAAATWDEVWYKITTLWPSTSPVADFNLDSGVDDARWDMSTFLALENLYGEEGNVRYRAAAGNASGAAVSGSWLTAAQMASEADKIGRYLHLAVQLNGDGSQDAGFGGIEIAVDVPGHLVDRRVQYMAGAA